MHKNQEPYEVFPEEPEHAKTDYFTHLIANALLIMLALLAAACPAHAAGNNWCGDWFDGYKTGYCWSQLNCTYVPNVTCPDPQPGQYDGYMVGLNAGLSAGKIEI